MKHDYLLLVISILGGASFFVHFFPLVSKLSILACFASNNLKVPFLSKSLICLNMP